MKDKTKVDCCGSNFETNDISTLGLLTLSVPMIVIGTALNSILYIFSYSSYVKKIRSSVTIIISANIKLIEKKDINPRLRCNFSNVTSTISVTVSRFLYRHFNFILLSLPWIVIITGITGVINFV